MSGERIADHAALVLTEHERRMTPEVLRCSCGWYVERGAGAARAYAAHQAAMLDAAGLLISPELVEWW